MNKDSALRKALVLRTDDLPEGFEQRVMGRVLLEAEKKSRREEYLSLFVVCFVSLMLLAGGFFVLNYFFSFNILHLFSNVQFRMEYSPIFTYCIFIASIILILLGLDYKFRQMLRKARGEHGS